MPSVIKESPTFQPNSCEDKKLEQEALNFLSETLGIKLAAAKAKNLEIKPQHMVEPWTCLSCLLTQVYNLFCKAGPEGDALFIREVEQSKFERVSAAIKPAKLPAAALPLR